MKSGFVAIVGRPNVGKSTLVNQIVGEKVSIVSSHPNTTRFNVRGVCNRTNAQIVLVDTPGLHRPKSALGSRLNDAAVASLSDVDVVVAIVDATGAIGPGDRVVIKRAVEAAVRGGVKLGLLVVVNKTDRARSEDVLLRLATASDAVGAVLDEIGGASILENVEYFPLSARTGEGVEGLIEAVIDRLPSGPRYFPDDMSSDVGEAMWVAELVREQLLSVVRDELPHSIACRVTEWEWPRIRCEIVVERDSQKAIVIGRGGEVLKAVGTAVRRQLRPGAYLELFVKVEKRWQGDEGALDRLGY
ncbi:MAG: GTPase Era [Acidimicrobiales bacterium]